MNGFVGFMRSTIGRVIRIVAGLALMWWGFFGGAGVIVGIVGIVVFLAGAVNFCIFAPLFGRTIWGKPRTAN